MSFKRTGKIAELLREKINELMAFALTTPTEKADVFVEFAPHCNTIDIRAYIEGWRTGYDPAISRWITLPRSDDPDLTTTEDAIDAIDQTINEIKEAIK